MWNERKEHTLRSIHGAPQQNLQSCDLGSNKTTASISQVAKTLRSCLQQFDEQNDVKQPSGHHAKVIII